MSYQETAKQKHRGGYNCSQALYSTFCDAVGMTDSEARAASMAWAGGRMVKCGAVYAAEEILRQLYPDSYEQKIAEYERLYAERNGSVDCARMRSLTNSKRKPCNEYVGDAAEILEKMI